MAEQFRVVRRDDQRRAVQKSGDALGLFDALIEKMPGVFARGLQGEVALVNLLFPGPAGDAIILDAGETAVFRRRQVRLHVIEIEVEADVAVKIAVTRVAGITFVLAPDLARRIEVAPERGDAVGRENRRERAVARARAGVQQAVRVEDEPADVRLLQKYFDALHVGAFRQPDADAGRAQNNCGNGRAPSEFARGATADGRPAAASSACVAAVVMISRRPSS